jgi:hypothetical protein
MNEVEKLNAYCFALIHACRQTNAEELKVTQTKVHHNGEQLGDWEIIVRKI